MGTAVAGVENCLAVTVVFCVHLRSRAKRASASSASAFGIATNYIVRLFRTRNQTMKIDSDPNFSNAAVQVD
jgi:hypothetical protein